MEIIVKAVKVAQQSVEEQGQLAMKIVRINQSSMGENYPWISQQISIKLLHHPGYKIKVIYICKWRR